MKRALFTIAALLLLAAYWLWAVRRDDKAAPAPTPTTERVRAVSGDERPELGTAIPPELAAAKAEREAAVAALTASGKTAAWANDGNLLLEKLAHDSHAAGWRQVGCFAAGCAGTLMYASAAALSAGRALV